MPENNRRHFIKAFISTPEMQVNSFVAGIKAAQAIPDFADMIYKMMMEEATPAQEAKVELGIKNIASAWDEAVKLDEELEK